MRRRHVGLSLLAALLITSTVSTTYAKSQRRTAIQYAEKMEDQFRILKRIELGGKVPDSIYGEAIPVVVLRVIGKQCGVSMAKINGVIYTFDEDRTVGFAITVEELRALIKSEQLPRCYNAE
jgi:hypothetical protein